MKTKLMKSLLTALCLLCSINIRAEWIKDGDVLYSLNVYVKEAEVLKYFGTPGSANIPSHIVVTANDNTRGTYVVNSIRSYAFKGCTGLTSVNIPNSVTKIGDSAFQDCTGLTSANISNGVRFIGNSVFKGCTGLTSVNIPNSVTEIGDSAFIGCTGLTSVDIPNSVKDIGRSVFSGCTGLTSVDIPNSVTSIGNFAFSGCTGLTSLDIPNSVTKIGIRAFSGCTGLTSINSFNPTPPNSEGYFVSTGTYRNATLYVPQESIELYCVDKSWGYFQYIQCLGSDGLKFSFDSSAGTATVIGYDKTKMSENPVIPQDIVYNKKVHNKEFYTVVAIGENAFNNCQSLSSVSIPNSVTSIGNSAFQSCTGLSSVSIPNSVTSIGNSVFQSCTGLSSVSIPNSVTSIGSSAFQGCTGLSSVSIPNSVTSIGCSAFQGCTGLSSVSIPNSVMSIDRSAFQGCTGLSSVSIPKSVKAISGAAFQGCNKLGNVNIDDVAAWCNIKFERADANPLRYAQELLLNGSVVRELVIPDSVTSIGNYAFSDYANLTSVDIPENVTAIGDETFKGCTNLTTVYSANRNPSSVGELCFYNVNATVYVPHEAVLVYEMAEGWKELNIQSNASGLTYSYDTGSMTATVTGIDKGLQHITIPATTKYQNKTYAVATIGDNAFKNNVALKSVDISKRIKSIGNNAFRGCSGLTSVNISNSVTTIGNNAFLNCSGLTSMDIPNNVTTIGSDAFSGCSGLTSMDIHDLAAWCNIKFGNEKSNPLFYAKNFCLNGEKLTKLVIPDNVTSISDYAFQNCTGFTVIYSLIQTPPRLQNNSFDDSYHRNVTLYVPQQSIEKYKTDLRWSYFNIKAFDELGLEFSYNNDNMTADVIGFNKDKLPSVLEIPATTTYMDETYNVTGIGYSAFKECTGLTSVNIPNSVTFIGSSAFSGCNGLTSVNIPNNVTTIGDDAFRNCSSLISVDIPNSVTTIGNAAFLGCSSLTSANISNGVTTIEYAAFLGCSGLTSVNIPNSVTTIGDSAFENCSGLTSVNIPNSVTTIGGSAFEGCSSLTSVNIPNGVTTIGNGAFSGCSGLTSVNIPNSVTTIGSDAFSGCSGLTSVNIPNGVTTIEYAAFADCTGLTSVNIPNSITYIGSYAFYGCDGLKVNVNDLAAWCKIKFEDNTANPLSRAHLYLNGEEITDLAIPDGVKSISRFAFYGCDGLKSVRIPDGILILEDSTFCDCKGLTSLTLSKSVRSISANVFSGCDALASIYSFNPFPPDLANENFSSTNYQNATLYVPDEAVEEYKTTYLWQNFMNIKGFDLTGIKDVGIDGDRQQNVYYDLSGRRLNAPQKGLNIINGKKLIVK